MSTSAMAWMATAVSAPLLATLADGKLESSKQVTKALKCVAFTNMQVGSMMSRKRERLERRLAAVADEIRLLEADLAENAANHELRRSMMDDIEDDLDQARALGNEQMESELREEQQVLQDEAKREQVLFRNLQKTVRARRRVHKDFVDEKRAVEDAMNAFTVKQNLIQTLLASCTKRSPSNCDTLSSSGSESECGSSDHSESSLDQDLAMAGSRSALARDRPLSPTREPMRSSLRWSGTNSDTSSQASSQAAKRGRSVSFSPLPPTRWGDSSDDEDKAASEGGGGGFQRRRQYERKLIVRQYPREQQMQELGDSDEEGDDSEDDSSEASSVDLSSVKRASPVAAAKSKVSIEEAARAEYLLEEEAAETVEVAA